MKLIIDGYNLLKHIEGADFVDERVRTKFIEKIGAYSRKKQLPIVLVFDGGPSLYPTREKHNGVEVVYSGTKESADEYIQQYVEDVPTHTMLLISSDKELVNYVQYHGLDALDSQAFYTFMQAALAEAAPEPIVRFVTGRPKKLHPEERNSELDAIMEEAARVIVRKSDDVVKEELAAPKHKVSKKDRLRALKLKKL